MDDARQAQMRRALELAERGWGRVSPNPMVGAVVDVATATCVGEGWHEGPGTAHAEVMALAAAGDLARGATVVCTLEPCNRFGRTPPCTRALIEAGVAARGRGAPPTRTSARTRPGSPSSARPGIEVERGRARRRGRGAQRGVRSPRHHRPSVRHPEDGLEPRRQDGRGRRHLAMDHRRGRPCRRASAARLGRRGGRGRRHGDRRRPVAHRARARFAGRAAADAGRGRRRGPGAADLRLFDGVGADAGRDHRSRARGPRSAAWTDAGAEVAVLDRDAAGARLAAAARRRARASATSRACSSKAAPRSPGALVRDGLVDRVVALPRARCSSEAPPRRAMLAGDGLRADRRGAAARRSTRVERIGGRPEGGGRCSPGIVEELRRGPRRSTSTASRWAADVVPADSDVGASVAVNGVCLTVVERRRRVARFDLSEETIARTSLRRLARATRSTWNAP